MPIPNPDSELIHQPGLATRTRRPFQYARLAPWAHRELCILFPSNNVNVFRNIGYWPFTVSIQDNHGDPDPHHYHWNGYGLFDEYDGVSFSDGECLVFNGNKGLLEQTSTQQPTTVHQIAWGAVWQIPAGTSDTNRDFIFICDHDDGTTAGHPSSRYNGLATNGYTGMQIDSGSDNFTFTVPAMNDGRRHAAIALAGYDGTNRWAQLVMDGVVYARQDVASVSGWYLRAGTQYPFAACGPSSSHHNRSLGGTVEMVWLKATGMSVDEAVAETLDPYQIFL